jgi:hypothetical protein
LVKSICRLLKEREALKLFVMGQSIPIIMSGYQTDRLDIYHSSSQQISNKMVEVATDCEDKGRGVLG